MIAVGAVAIALGQPGAAVILAVFMVILAATATAIVASLIALALKLEARHRNRSQLPPSPGPAGRTSAPQKVRKPPRRPHGSLAVGQAG